MVFTFFFCICFDGEFQLRFTIRFSFTIELGSIVHHVLKNSKEKQRVREEVVANFKRDTEVATSPKKNDDGKRRFWGGKVKDPTDYRI